MSKIIEQGVCKTVRSLGLTPVETRKIVDGVSFALRHNGPDWVLSRVKSLRDYYAGTGDFPAWVSYKHRKYDGLLKPKGWMGYLVGARRNPDTVMTVCASVIGAITYEQPTDKQLQKWYEAVANPPKADALPKETIQAAMPSIADLEKNLKKKLDQVQAFGPDNISGTSIPVGYDLLRVKRGKKLDVRGLYDAYIRSLESAPANSWSFLDQSGIRIPGVKMSRSRVLINKARKSAPDFRPKKTDRKLSSETYPIGHISFLQKPFGKLRTVANPNRFVQWELIPLGEVLSDWINHQPGVYVTNQGGAIEWTKGRLSRGVHLTSADLSSASDTLDYKEITAALKAAGPEMRKHLEYFEWCSTRSWLVPNEQAKDFLKRKGCDTSTIRWKQGQPLGLRPSFPLMTACNLIAARAAVIRLDGRISEDDPPFAIVGDDIVIETKYAAAYSDAITAMGGVANLDKSLSSDEQAEICSRLVRRDQVLRLKPRYLFDNDPQNVLTYQDTSLRVRCAGWVREYAKKVGSYSLVESGLVPLYHGDQPKRISVRDLFHTVQSLSREEAAMETEMSSLSMWYAYQHSTSSVSPDMVMSEKRRKPTLKLKVSSYEDKVRVFNRWNKGVITPEELTVKLGLTKSIPTSGLRHILIEKAFYMLQTSEAARSLVPEVRWIRDPETQGIHAEIEAESARMQTVNSVKIEYDYRSDSFKTVEKPENQLRRLHRSVNSFESGHITDEAGDHWIAPLIAPTSSDPRSNNVGPSGVDILVEDKGSSYELSFHSPSQSSKPQTVEKTVPGLEEFFQEQLRIRNARRSEEAENLLSQSLGRDKDRSLSD